MKIGLFYVSQTPALDTSWVIGKHRDTTDVEDPVFVRLEVVEAADADAALDLGKPRKGEQFLNSMPLPVPA